MNFWKNLIKNLNNEEKTEFTSRLHEKIKKYFPDKDEQFHIKTACLSGLMARIAFADLKIDLSEQEVIKKSLHKWMSMTEEEASLVSKVCVEEIRDLAGNENHLYCLPLRESLAVTERYKIIETLFAVAAADGSVDNKESEEIRNINNGLLLEPKHFSAARATVLEYLASLKD